MLEIIKGKTLLIVDDEKDLREPLAMEFESLGCTVFQAGNGREGFAILQREKIDAVISDIRMPGGDGIELLKNIKNLHHAFPVMMLITGFSDLSKEDAYHLGADAILAKPFDLDEIDATLARILTAKSERWEKPVESAAIKQKIEKSFSSLTGASSDDSLGLGRGGFFLKISEQLPGVGHAVSFHIKFDEGDILLIEGSGVVRWVRPKEEKELPEGCGIEFESLNEPARTAIVALTESLKLKPYIPKSAHL